MRRPLQLVGAAALAGYIGTIFAANYAISHWGAQAAPGAPHTIPVWPWPYLEAPSGVLFVGAALLLRDVVQWALGRWVVLAAIAVGAALSWLVATPEIAVASGLAFALSEVADMAVYTPLARRRLTLAVVASNVVGAVVDSAVFLWVAFASLEFIEGQVAGKLLVTAATLPVLYLVRRRLRAVSRDAAVT